MRFSETDYVVRRALEESGDVSEIDIARRTKIPHHTVRYGILKFRRANIIKKRYFINVYKISLSRYSIFFSVALKKEQERLELIQKLKKSPYVALILELGGEYQFEINVVVQDPQELEKILDLLSLWCNHSIINRSISLQSFHRSYGTRCFLNRSFFKSPKGYFLTSATEKLDVLDHALLKRLMEHPEGSNRDHAVTLKVSTSTIDRRITEMKERGVITGSVYTFEDPSTAGYILLIRMQGAHPSLREKFLDFSSKHPLVHYITGNVGAWDFELGLTVRKPSDVAEFIPLLYSNFQSLLQDVQCIPFFSVHKICDYPLN